MIDRIETKREYEEREANTDASDRRIAAANRGFRNDADRLVLGPLVPTPDARIAARSIRIAAMSVIHQAIGADTSICITDRPCSVAPVRIVGGCPQSPVDLEIQIDLENVEGAVRSLAERLERLAAKLYRSVEYGCKEDAIEGRVSR